MKKHVIVALALTISMLSFAQKKELKTIEKAIKSNNFSEAKSVLIQVESMLSSMDDKEKDKFYFLKGQAFYANGAGSDVDLKKSIESFNNVKGTYTSEVDELKQNMINSILTKSNNLFISGEYDKAAIGFYNLYELDTSDQSYLYYAAVSAIRAENYDAALSHYTKLKDLGYDGVEKIYFATNKATGEVENLDKSSRDAYVKLGTHETPGEKMTESKIGEITKNIVFIHINKGEEDKALEAINDARAANPDDVSLIISEANLYYKLGDNENYTKLIKEALERDPNNANLYFNLGVLAANSGDNDKAEEYYKKSIEIDPNNVDALTNLGELVLREEQLIVEKMNSLGNSAADNKMYDELKLKRKNVYIKAVPYLEKVLALNGDKDVAKTLANIFSVIGEDEKAKALLEKYE